MLKCKICCKKAENRDYCVLHEKAYRNLVEKFELWKKGLNLSWKDYLNNITNNPFTGKKRERWQKPTIRETIKPYNQTAILLFKLLNSFSSTNINNVCHPHEQTSFNYSRDSL